MRFFFLIISFLLVLSGCSYSTVDALYKTPPECEKPYDDVLDKYCPHLKDPGKIKSEKCVEEETKEINRCYKSLGRPVPWAHEFPPGVYYIDPRCEKTHLETNRSCGKSGRFGCLSEIAEAINKCYADLGMPEKKVGAGKYRIAR